MPGIVGRQLCVKQGPKVLTTLFRLFCRHKRGTKIVLDLYTMNGPMFSVVQRLVVYRIFSSIPETTRLLKSNLLQHGPPNFRTKTSNRVKKPMPLSDRKLSNNFSLK